MWNWIKSIFRPASADFAKPVIDLKKESVVVVSAPAPVVKEEPVVVVNTPAPVVKEHPTVTVAKAIVTPKAKKQTKPSNKKVKKP